MIYGNRHILLILFFTLGPNLAYGQTLTVDSIHALQFGTQIFPGITKSISRTNANAAKFVVAGESNRLVQITFQLPPNLRNTNNNILNINFSSTAAGYSTSELNQQTSTGFDPNSGVITALNNSGNLYIWLGGEVIPLHSQPGDFYSANIIINVAYSN